MKKEDYYILDLDRKEDPRGALFEILRFKDEQVPGEGYIYTFTINKDMRRGDHYHLRKKEWFSCVSGAATVLIEKTNGEKNKIILNAEHPSVIYCGPGVAHALYNEADQPAVIVSYGSKQHDPKDPDTIHKFIKF